MQLFVLPFGSKRWQIKQKKRGTDTLLRKKQALVNPSQTE